MASHYQLRTWLTQQRDAAHRETTVAAFQAVIDRLDDSEEGCPVCGDDMPAGQLACSAGCMRIERFHRRAAGLPDPMMLAGCAATQAYGATGCT